MEHAVPGLMVRRLFALGGGLVFIGSLLFFVVQYRWRFDTLPEPSGGAVGPILTDLGLFTAFALHHSIFARGPWKDWARSAVSPALERSAYVWIAGVLFALTCAWWQPVAGTAWRSAGPLGLVLTAGQLFGGAWSVYCARRLDPLHFAGVRQAIATGPVDPAPHALDTAGPYAFVRHPIYFGWLMVVWLAPVMTGTRLVFAGVSTFYLAIAVPFEERELTRTFGDAYDAYRRRVRWRMLPLVY